MSNEGKGRKIEEEISNEAIIVTGKVRRAVTTVVN